jgi:hypothetical protein
MLKLRIIYPNVSLGVLIGGCAHALLPDFLILLIQRTVILLNLVDLGVNLGHRDYNGGIIKSIHPGIVA